MIHAMKKYNLVTPEGTKDLLFEDCLAHRKVEEILSRSFAARGFQEVVTPAIEFYDVMDPAVSGINPEIMYKTVDHHGRLIVLRPDSTMPIARLASTRLQNQPKPLRLYYTQAVYRNHPGLTGRQDENMETGVELLGAGGRRADLEAVLTAVEALSQCIPDFRLELGHAGFFKALAAQLPVSAEKREEIREIVEAKNYAALNSLLDELPASPSVSAMRRLPRLFGGEEVFSQAEPLCITDEARGMLEYLRTLYKDLANLGLKERLMVDLSLVQRNDYYTGIVFSAYTENWGDAVLMGGRYDKLLENFQCPMPAVGFSINVTAVAKLLLEKGKIQKPKAPDVLVHGENGYELQALLYASRLVEQGGSCENSVFLSLEEAKEYAAQRGIGEIVLVSDAVKRITVDEKGGKKA